ncbi:hypothetical protein FB567DRAFT_441179 [Paraphoma chrysanthemicola]|uniref:Uncharacterized protein n=1 Tax=Paraphoma chrysanthemicola TaxID=798071 RepID=A0A8K0VZJ1_9PLEO|nr:hypothetical protein FB567DRAFT_441179 [Paraphoma chrysanthemicola]
MLTCPDRQKFDAIRARWEAAQPGEEEATKMVGRKVSQAPVECETHSNVGSKFRRKLSHGFAFFSHPLSQRKITPGRQVAEDALLAVTAPATSNLVRPCEAPLSPTHRPPSLKRSEGGPVEPQSGAYTESPSKVQDPDATPKALPRSRTTSFLPRPVRLEPETVLADTDRTSRLPPRVGVLDANVLAMPSKIPTPSPPLSERRVSSPRQYQPQSTTTQARPVAPIQVFGAFSAGSPTKAAIRSRMTPNMVKDTNSQRPASYMTQTKAGLQRLAATPAAQKPHLQENIPTNKRVIQRHSQYSEKSPRPESLAIPSAATNRRSFGPGATLSQSKQPNQSTPLAAKQRLNSNLAPQTPFAARRAPQSEHGGIAQQTPLAATSSSTAQSRLMGPRNAPTPAPSIAETPRPSLPRSTTDKDLQRKTLGTPNGLGGVWRASRALAVANYEVRSFPRSSTFHDFGTHPDAAPPVPPIPEQYRVLSLSNLFQFSLEKASCRSIPEETIEKAEAMPFMISPKHSRPDANQSSSQPSNSSTNLTVLPSVLRDIPTTDSTSSLPSTEPLASLPFSQTERPWSISDRQYEDSADAEPHLQIRDYMPPLYWAGRFQARFDQWRTEAMMVELNPNRLSRAEGQLSRCKLEQDKLAACYIFAQLRDLCLTDQAADSLWEFESKYRKDNKLLGNPEYPMQPPRKHDDQGTPKGAFGRAVRKLTPRKSSFVNLLKGKGWGKSEETKALEAPEQSTETSSGST